MVEDPELAVAIKDRQIVGFLIFRHVLGQVEAFDDESLQLFIDSVISTRISSKFFIIHAPPITNLKERWP